MKCSLNGGSTKVFAKAVQSLSKFGGDLYLEANEVGMQLRTLNPTRSAVGTYKFGKNFFDHYEVNHGEESYCKLDMRACLTVFRNTKQVERCDMVFLNDKAKFQIQLKCQLETLKNTFISVDDEENITADMAPEITCNIIRGSHKIFSEISNNFNPAEEEITLEAEDKCVTIKNYVEGSRVNEKFMRSQLKLNADEFETYKVEKETCITFCLKEFRALLLLAEALNENLFLQFDEAGSPVFVGIKHRDDIDCLLIMSTLSPDEVSFYDNCQESEVHENVVTKAVQKRKLTISEQKQNLPKKCIAEDTTLSNSTSIFQFDGSSSKRRSSSSLAISRNQPEATTAVQNLVSLATDTSASSFVHPIQQQTDFPIIFCDTEPPQSAISSETTDEDCIPASPNTQNRANLRTIFSRCFESTYVQNEPSAQSQIYACASDTED